MTKARYKMMKDGVKVNKSDLAAVGPYFVRTKKDRDPIMYLAHKDDKNKQICRVLIKYVIEEQHAIVLMTEVGEAMIKDPSGDPYEIRDAVLAKYRESHADAPEPKTRSRKRRCCCCCSDRSSRLQLSTCSFDPAFQEASLGTVEARVHAFGRDDFGSRRHEVDV